MCSEELRGLKEEKRRGEKRKNLDNNDLIGSVYTKAENRGCVPIAKFYIEVVVERLILIARLVMLCTFLFLCSSS